MNSPHPSPVADSRCRRFIVHLLLILLLLSGCARKPWGDPFAEADNRLFTGLFEDMRSEEKQCPACSDGDINVFLTSRVGKRAAAGYFQLMQPDHIKFIASNPLGQPLLIFTSDGESFQYINTIERLSLAGGVTPFFQTLDAPPALVSSSWGRWLTGRLPLTGTVETVRPDDHDRGVWLTISSAAGDRQQEHLLIDPENRLLLSRIVTEQGNIVMQIDYPGNDQDGGNSRCRLPETLHVSGLDYGAELTLTISKPGEYSGCSPADFILRVPAGDLHREIE